MTIETSLTTLPRIRPEANTDETPGSETRNDQWARERPRLLSYIGRWGRARRWLPPDAHRVIDVGCAFGYGTVALMGRGNPPQWIAGVERDPENVRLAGELYPWLPMVRADATSLPFDNQSMDAAVILDVLEHLDDPETVLEEVRRVLKPGGSLVVSVPHRGLLAASDSNNVYTSLCSRCRSFLPLEPCETSASGEHRHFTANELRETLGSGFLVDRVARTGLGFAEWLHIALLVVFKGILRWRAPYMALRHFYFAASLLEDLIPGGPLGYNLTVRARTK